MLNIFQFVVAFESAQLTASFKLCFVSRVIYYTRTKSMNGAV